MSDFIVADHYEITGAGITGTIDLAGLTGQPFAAIEVDGQSLAEPSVETDEAGVQVKATVQQVDDGDTVRLQLVLPEVNISDDPVTVAGFAVLLTERSSIAGPSLVKGPLELYDLRPIAATASAVRTYRRPERSGGTETARTFVRDDVWSLAEDDPVVTAYADAVAAMMAKEANDPTSWAYQAAIHGTYATPPLPGWNECRHGTWYFVSWHRMYLYYFERVVRAQVVANGGPSDWALPYWNYDGGGDHNTLPLAFRNPTRADGSVNPLYVADRSVGINTGAGLPSAITSPAFALGRPTFTGTSEFGGGVTSPLSQFWSQTGRLEQTPHNDVHVVIGGLMGDPDTAAQDPIFWLHHANIDRVWWLWHQEHSDPSDSDWTDQSFDFSDVGGVPASLTAAGILDTVDQLDYTYDHAILRVPWPPTWLDRLPVKWPWPWPERPEVRRVAPGPRPDPAPDLRHLVGASDQSIRLVGDVARAPIQIDERVTESLQADAGAAELHHRAFLDVEDIEAERNPGMVYGVYVNLPDQPAEADLAEHHVGNVSLFGVERARNPRGDEHAHGLRVSMEITDLLDRLANDGKWTEGQRLDVTFRPITVEPPTETARRGEETDLAEAARKITATAHPDTPITIGRVSVHFA